MVVKGIGVDVVDVARFKEALAKAPGLVGRLFVDGERGLGAESLAARFAAKEAVLKELSAAGGLSATSDWRWRDVIVHKAESGAPYLEVTSQVAQWAAASGITRWHLSLTHDGGMAMAFVIAESASS